MDAISIRFWRSRPACSAIPAVDSSRSASTAARTTSNNYFIDGLYNNDRYYGDSAINQTGILGIPAVTFPPEAIEELSVQETPSAEFGVKGGAPILLNMKSGTNTWHGGAHLGQSQRHWRRRQLFRESQYDDCSGPGECKPTPIHNNQFHANIGGPIIKDKAFFFLFYEGQRNKSEAVKSTERSDPEGDRCCRSRHR